MGAKTSWPAGLRTSSMPQPNSSDAVIVSKSVYNPRWSAAGPIVDTIDNAGHISETQYDLAGRTIRTIANYDNGAVEETDTDRDLTTEYQYDSFGRLVTTTALDAKGRGQGIVDEPTHYVYQSPDDASLVTAVIAADSTDAVSQDAATGDWSITTDHGDHTSTTYDWLGRTASTTDQRGVVHAYSYDPAGRLAADTVTSLGRADQNVDGTVRRIGSTYDDLGRQQSVTSYGDTEGTFVLDQDCFAYDGWGNLVEEWQATDGAVAPASTPSVQYVYADGATGGVARYVRLTDVIYPNGRDIAYGYGPAGSTDDILSRVRTIGDSGGILAAYRYLGAGTLVSEDL
jgi:YD repeat-containing protein